MQKRKYVHIKLIEDQIQIMRADGMTNREIADHFGLNLKQVKNWVNRHKPKTLAEATDLIDRYIYFYNHERIQTKTGMAPLTLRHSA